MREPTFLRSLAMPHVTMLYKAFPGLKSLFYLFFCYFSVWTSSIVKGNFGSSGSVLVLFNEKHRKRMKWQTLYFLIFKIDNENFKIVNPSSADD
jgi:hypothetical protein